MANLGNKGLPDATVTPDESKRRKLMREGRDSFREFVATLPKMDDSTPLIREDRDGGHPSGC